MPIYGYVCEKCNFAKDNFQKMSDPVLTKCPACGAEAYRKQLSAAGFQLKGSGWYATDFKSPPASASPASKSTQTESTPAAGGCSGGCSCHSNQ